MNGLALAWSQKVRLGWTMVTVPRWRQLAWELSKQGPKSDAQGSVPPVSLLCVLGNSLTYSVPHMNDLENNSIDLIGLLARLNDELTVPALAKHITLEWCRKDQHRPCARITCKFLKHSIFGGKKGKGRQGICMKDTWMKPKGDRIKGGRWEWVGWGGVGRENGDNCT